MDTDNLPFYRTLSFKLLVSISVFILIIEAILMVFSVFGMNQRLLEIRRLVPDVLPPRSPDLEKNYFRLNRSIYFWKNTSEI